LNINKTCTARQSLSEGKDFQVVVCVVVTFDTYGHVEDGQKDATGHT